MQRSLVTEPTATHDAGATWAEEGVPDFACQTVSPYLAVTEDYLHVVWLDNRSGPGKLHTARRALLSNRSR